jgi:holliday junction DNA helicase RuvA
LELKDKLSKQQLSESISPGWSNSLEQDALTALVALGISRQQAEQSIQKITLADPSVSKLEDLIKKALKAI